MAEGNGESAAEWLRERDSNPVYFEGRVTRLEWLVGARSELVDQRQFNHVMLAGGDGKVAQQWVDFEEMQRCFIGGEFLATILVGFAFIERILASYLYEVNRTELEGATFGRLLEVAERANVISEDEAKALRAVSANRNSYAHFRRPGDQRGIVNRTVAEGSASLWDLIEKDACITLRAAFRFTAKLGDTLRLKWQSEHDED